MANTQLSGDRYEFASIDTAPGAEGFWTKKVKSGGIKGKNGLQVSISGGGTAVVTIQYLLPHDDASWTDYTTSETLESGGRFRLEDLGFHTLWRIGVKNGDYTSDTIIVGFDW